MQSIFHSIFKRIFNRCLPPTSTHCTITPKKIIDQSQKSHWSKCRHFYDVFVCWYREIWKLSSQIISKRWILCSSQQELTKSSVNGARTATSTAWKKENGVEETGPNRNSLMGVLTLSWLTKSWGRASQAPSMTKELLFYFIVIAAKDFIRFKFRLANCSAE